MKVLITEGVQVNYGDDRGGQHAEAGETIDVPKEQARKLAEANRCLYLSKADDPTKDGRFTASKEQLAAAAALAKAKAAEETKA